MEKAAIHEGTKLSDSRHAQGRTLGLVRSWPILFCLFAACTTTGKASDAKTSAANDSGSTANGQAQKFNPKLEDPGATNPNPEPSELKGKSLKASEQQYVHFQASDNDKLSLDIDQNGWAYWSASSHAVFSKYMYNGDMYLIYEYGNSYTGYYLSYKNNGYMAVYQWGNSVPWTIDGDGHVLHVKGKDWKTYEYQTDKQWVVIGNYNYTQRDLKAVDGF